VVTQDVCRVCAVPASQVEEELEGVRIIRQHPHSLEDVLADIEELAEAAGADPAPLLEALRERLARAAVEARRRPPGRGGFLEAFLITAVLTVLGLRVYLAAAHYPQLGGNGLHIAHVLWGGLAMAIAIGILLALLTWRAHWVAAAVGGAGLGLFIDELGKF